MAYLNKKASYEYHFLENYTAGIQLLGSEIKSIRAGKVNITDGFCFFKDEELFLHNVNIEQYKYSSYLNHEPKRPRKLLLKKRELKRLLEKSNEKGLAIIPVKLFINETGLAKIEITLAKGKKLYDKRQQIQDRDMNRDLERQYN
jgi:SsrA-binding protein